MVARQLQTPTDVAAEMVGRSEAEAAEWLTEWLRRRDALATEMAAEHLSEALASLASELRGEARYEATARTKGLLLAATVLFDTAGGVLVGDSPTPPESSLPGQTIPDRVNVA